MNLYICSTVRHLLFALCRASRDDEKHRILFFSDYQNTSLKDWRFDALPDNVSVAELSRKEFRDRFRGSLTGQLLYWYAMRCPPAAQPLQKRVIGTLAHYHPELAGELRRERDLQLWLFNERNRMARLFRLLADSFTIIEDGESNYLTYPLPWWKVLPRRASGLPPMQRFLGDDPRCTEIWVNYPDRLAPGVRTKGRLIDFLEGPEAANMMRQLMGDRTLPSVSARSVILATQPLDGMAKIPVADKQKIYDTIISLLESEGREILLKLHPAENPEDYEPFMARTIAAPAKMPIEALVLTADESPIVLSISSAAGLGFERFCKRIKLIEYDDTDSVRHWIDQPDELKGQVREGLATI